ncbi:AI-2E family transporter [Rhodoferax saidenbachensis]|uniref:AI-2E family transporter n=1 Tax=Rhodoferax saidenbachensis TaxID=1484693 RepID=A0A1P8KBH9_9BURK|nr:AI-2E family transporter [Rhodoferax saidenbachensis]APW43377.1 AI-2E family transporter [Rhodoferax saidenbachensis]
MQFTPTQKRFIAWALIALLLVGVLWLLAPVLAPFVVASVLAYALTPLVDWLDDAGRGRIPRLVAVVLVELLFVVALLGVLLLIVPIFAKELPLMREQLPVLLDSINGTLKPWLAQWGIHISLDVTSIKGFVMKYLNANVEDAVGSVLASVKLGGSVAFAIIGNAILIPVALFYLLMDWDRFVAQVRNFIPPRMRAGTDSFLAEADAVLGQYLRGQLLVMLTLAVGYSVGLALFGLDLALPIGIFTGLAIFVPYLGFGVGLVLATFAGLLEFSSTGVVYPLVMVAVVYGLGQLIESLYLTPRLVGERIGLHPLAVIFALLAFGQLFGFVGVLVALPVSAVLLVAIRRIRASYLASRLYLG